MTLLQQIEALLAETEKATPGPWKSGSSPYPYGQQCLVQYSEIDGTTICVGGYQNGHLNAEFTARARTSYPAALRALKLAVEYIESGCGHKLEPRLDECGWCKRLAAIEKELG